MARDSWSVLPIDLLNLVLNLVSLSDVVRLTAACKSWRQPALDYLRRRRRNLPWIIAFDNGQQLRKLDLIDPWLNKSYPLLKIIRRDGLEELLLGTSVHAYKYGWLLMSKQHVIKAGGSSKLISFLFYNPFRNEIIELSPLDLNPDNHEDLKVNNHELKAMFSTTPTSPDCVIFMVSRVTRERKAGYMLSTYKDKNWTSITDGVWDDYWRRDKWEVQDVVHMDGKFFCSFNRFYQKSHIKLCIFNVALRQWSTNKYDLQEDYDSMFELDGELLLVTGALRTWKVRRFYQPGKSWTRTRTLDDGVLLMNHTPDSSSSITAVGEDKEFANMIVRLGIHGYQIYTLKDDQGSWTYHQTRACDPRGEYNCKFWIDCPKFQT